MKNKFIEALKANKMAKMGKVVTKDEDLTLAELRAKYPEIKSNSKDGFLKKLNS